MIIDLDEVCYIESLFEQYNKIFTKYSYKNQEEALITLILTFLQYLKAIWPEEVWGKQKKDGDKHKNEGGKQKKDLGKQTNSAILLGERATNNAEKIMEWIEEHYWTKFELDQLSKELHMSPYHISHLFKQAIGTSITEYLNARRMRQACWLLKSSDAPIEYIGQQVGLANFSYFCQLFKKITGVTPHKYRSSIF
jgi:YesN/AraC family two-component response regulator